MQSECSANAPQHLSQAFIWGLQAKYYQSMGIEAWLSGMIPSRVTTNSHIAWRFARLIACYLSDVGAKKVKIVEFGAGHGRFAFLCASHLRRLLSHGTGREVEWKYVLTDVAERNIQFWERHSAFQSLRDDNRIDFARYEAGVDRSIHLRLSGEELDEKNPTEHLIVIANYFFDSLPMDVWKTQGDDLFACCPRFEVKEAAQSLAKDDPQILENLDTHWELVKTRTPAYSRKDWSDVADEMVSKVGEGTFTMPVGSFEAIETAQSWCSGPMMVLAADKGYPHADYYQGRQLPTMIHHGCFSFNVNFAALGKWFELRGGAAILPTVQHGVIEVAALIAGRDLGSLPRLQFEAEMLEQFSPDEYYQVSRRSDESDLSFSTALGLLKLSCYEPLVLHRLRRTIRGKLSEADSCEIEMLHEALERTFENYYHLEECDLSFTIGLIYHCMGEHEIALNYYRESLRWYGDQALTHLNIALCEKSTGRVEQAKASVQRCLELDPEEPDGLALHAELESEASNLST